MTVNEPYFNPDLNKELKNEIASRMRSLAGFLMIFFKVGDIDVMVLSYSDLY